MPELYGKSFYFRQFLSVRNAFVGLIVHIGFTIGVMLLALPPVRWLLRKFIFAPGSGPRREDSMNDRLEYHAIAKPEGEQTKRVFGKVTYEGGMYLFTGLLLAEAAMVILNDEETIRKVSRGGIVTPATMGQGFVYRLEKVGCNIELKSTSIKCGLQYLLIGFCVLTQVMFWLLAICYNATSLIPKYDIYTCAIMNPYLLPYPVVSWLTSFQP